MTFSAMLTDLFQLHSLFTLVMLILLQAVLGFDNLLYISLESKRVAEAEQAKVRRIGIIMAIALRIGLLFIVKLAIDKFQNPFFTFGSVETHEAVSATGPAHGEAVNQAIETGDWLSIAMNLESLVVLLGGAFIIYTAIKEIYHMLSQHDLGHGEEKTLHSTQKAIFWIVIMNLVFSFDSILSAMALTENMIVISIAIIASGLAMIYLADTVSNFLHKNRLYEVLGLFILFIVGIMLVSEGGHKAHLAFFGHPVHAMNKSTFYFVLAVLIVVDIVQSKYQRKLLAEKAKTAKLAKETQS